MKEKNMEKFVGLAINDYSMIKDRDQIMVGVSGGEDSIALVLLLQSRLKKIPVSYTLMPVMIDNWNGENSEQNKQIEDLSLFFEKNLNLQLEVIRLPMIPYLTESKNKPKKRNLCFKCAQIRRTTLIKLCLERGIKKLAFGHHKDDILETILMNLFYKRELSAMLPRLKLFDGKLEIIRPLAYLEKRHLSRYIKEKKVPIISASCPAKEVKKDLRREKVRKILKSLSKEEDRVKNNIFAAFRNPQNDYLLNFLFNPKGSGIHRRP